MALWIHGTLDSCQFGFMALWMHGTLDALHFGFMAVWIHGSLDLWQFGFMAVWIHGSLDSWHFGCTALFILLMLRPPPISTLFPYTHLASRGPSLRAVVSARPSERS